MAKLIFYEIQQSIALESTQRRCPVEKKDASFTGWSVTFQHNTFLKRRYSLISYQRSILIEPQNTIRRIHNILRLINLGVIKKKKVYYSIDQNIKGRERVWQTKQSKGIVMQHHGSLKRLGRGVRGQDQKKKKKLPNEKEKKKRFNHGRIQTRQKNQRVTNFFYIPPYASSSS